MNQFTDICSLWDVLGEGEVRHIADYATEHFKKTGQPLRIAVDEATWRFTNLTEEQVKKIRDGEPAANPIEKTILWRILRLWRLNIQLLFVYDGLRKPGKSRRAGRGGGKSNQDCIKMLHRMFKLLKVPYHQAPGEAEAECAKLQRLGVVDAVWSDDGDSFMFGCTTLIKAHKTNGKRVDDQIRVYTADSIAETRDLNANSFVLFALLAGGDYDTAGLRGCGPVNAARVCRRSFDLAQRIVNITPGQLPAWRHDLGQALREQIPSNFPRMEALDGYRKPAVSSDEGCNNLSQLRGGWVKEIDQPRLRAEFRDHYNFTTREYLKHLAPAFLARKLAEATIPLWRSDNLKYGVHLKSNRRTKDEDGNPTKSEVKIKYSAHELVDIDVSVQPLDEDWSKFAAKDGTPYDPRHKIECDMLECLLQHGLPPGSWDPPVKATKTKGKAKQGEESDAEGSGDDQQGTQAPADEPSASSSKKRKRTSKSQDGAEEAAPKKRGRPPKGPSENAAPAKKKRKSKKSEPEPEPESPPPTFRTLDIPDFKSPSHVVDLLDESDDDGNQTPTATAASQGSASQVPASQASATQVATPQISYDSPENKSTPTKGPPKFRPLSPRRRDKEASKSEPATTKSAPVTKRNLSSQEKAAARPKAPTKAKPPHSSQSRGIPGIEQTVPRQYPAQTSAARDKSAPTKSKSDTSLQKTDTARSVQHPTPRASTSLQPLQNVSASEILPPASMANAPLPARPETGEFVPGQTIDRAKLRELRLPALRNSAATIPVPEKPVDQPQKTTGAAAVVVDLT